MINYKSILRPLYRSIPMSLRLSKQYKSVHDFYNEAQWWSLDRISQWQLMKLQSIVKYAYDNVPGYRQIYKEAGVHPQDIRSLEDISILPFTTKSLLRDNLKDFTSSAIPRKRMFYSTTGGSTGIPFGFYSTRDNESIENAFMHNAWEQTGWKIDDRGVILRGAYVGSEDSLFSKIERNRYALSIYYLTDETYSSYIDFIVRVKPSFLHAYPSSAADFAKKVIYFGDQDRISFNSIFIGSENVYKWQKDIIKEAFPKAKLMSWYGHSEKAVWAPWCEKNEKYHICPFYGKTELIGNEQKEIQESHTGELVGTSFWMKATPFIRYRTNDYAVKGGLGCPVCGRNFRLLDSVEGRLQEMIVSDNGRYISMTSINMHDRTFDLVSQFRFVQREMGKLELLIIPQEEYSSDTEKSIRHSLIRKLGSDFSLSIKVVNEIKRTRSGKHTFLEQHIDIKHDNWIKNI